MDPKNYQNYIWINLCSLLPLQKVLKSNPNSTVTLTPNLTESFSTLRFFLWDTSVCKHRTWQIVRKLLNFYHGVHVWYHEILTNLIIFRLRLFFKNFKTIRPHVCGRVSWTRCSKYLFISWVRPHTGLNNMNIIFLLILLHYLNHLKCNKLIKYSKWIQKYTKS